MLASWGQFLSQASYESFSYPFQEDGKVSASEKPYINFANTITRLPRQILPLELTFGYPFLENNLFASGNLSTIKKQRRNIDNPWLNFIYSLFLVYSRCSVAHIYIRLANAANIKAWSSSVIQFPSWESISLSLSPSSRRPICKTCPYKYAAYFSCLP